MSINASIARVLEEYSAARSEAFAKHALASFIRSELPSAIRRVVGENARYLIKGSAGQSNWAAIPWAAIFDRLITETAQKGYYIVYLFREDGTGVYVSLNQGVTTVREQYGSDTKRALHARAADYLARIGKVDPSLIVGTIDLRTIEAAGLGVDYEQGAVCSLFYAKNELPSDEVLHSDLKLMLDYYFDLVSKESDLFNQTEIEEDENELDFEDLRLLRVHKRVERNKRLAARVKRKLGLVCQACGFNFENIYGEIGVGYIEAHHLTPVAELRGKRVSLDPKADFAVLCSNCHRMIHRSPYASDVESFRFHFLKA